MAWAEVGGGTQRATKVDNNVDTSALAYPGNVTNGSLLVLAGACFKSAAAPQAFTISDTLTTSYTNLTAALGANITLLIAYGLAPSGGANTITIDPSGTGAFLSWSIDEFSGSHATPLDVDGGSSTGTDSAPQDSLVTLVDSDLLIGVMSFSNVAAVTITPGGSYTQIGEDEDGVNDQVHNMVFRIVTTAQSYTVDWSTGSSVTWGAYTAAFKPAGGAAFPDETMESRRMVMDQPVYQ
jgi:hypothetical protein